MTSELPSYDYNHHHGGQVLHHRRVTTTRKKSWFVMNNDNNNKHGNIGGGGEYHDTEIVEDPPPSSLYGLSPPMAPSDDRHSSNSSNNSNGSSPQLRRKILPLDMEMTDEDDHVRLNAMLLEHDDDDDDMPVALALPFESSSSSGSWLEDWLYPPQLPRSCQLLRRENLAVPMCYLLVGLLQGLSGPLINVYPLDLNATEAQQTTLSSIKSLPSTFKIFFGFLSDNLPINGYRRKSYMLIGWFLASASLWGLLFHTNLKPIPDADAPIPPENLPTIPFLGLSLLLFGTGFWMADVMGDSIVAEKAKLEPIEARGSIQSSCYSYRFFGLMVAAPCSTLMYSYVGPGSIILLMTALPMCMIPLIWYLYEVPVAKVDRTDPLNPITSSNKNPLSSLPPITPRHAIASTRDQCWEIWNTVCGRAVWQPMGFVYLYNLLQVQNGAWKEFLRTVLGFTANQLNALLIVAFVLLYLGILAYKYCMIHWSWRTVYITTSLLGGFFSLLQVCLIYDFTFGISKFAFCLGDDAFAEFIGGIQFLPTTIMMVHLCPAGSEGASYAMFTTASNSALILSSAISTQLLGIWNVSKEALAAHQLQGMVNLTYLTTCIQLSGILFVGWLPSTKEDLFLLNQQTHRSSIGGAIFLFITFGSLFYSLFVGVLNIVAPGWMGES